MHALTFIQFCKKQYCLDNRIMTKKLQLLPVFVVAFTVIWQTSWPWAVDFRLQLHAFTVCFKITWLTSWPWAVDFRLHGFTVCFKITWLTSWPWAVDFRLQLHGFTICFKITWLTSWPWAVDFKFKVHIFALLTSSLKLIFLLAISKWFGWQAFPCYH